MSDAKKALEDAELYRQIAYELLTQAGAIKSCEMHNFYYKTHKYDNNMLYATVTDRFKKTYPDKPDFKIFQMCVGEIMNSAADCADACPACQKLMD